MFPNTGKCRQKLIQIKKSSLERDEVKGWCIRCEKMK